MKIFMLGWEFPPFISGGLGTACYGLTKAMNQLSAQVTFVLPKMVDKSCATHVNLLSPDSLGSIESYKINDLKNVTFHSITSPLKPYSNPDVCRTEVEKNLKVIQRFGIEGNQFIENQISGDDYSGDMYIQVHRYAAIAAELAAKQDFDVVHAHDWMTYPAGVAVARMSGKPLVVHVHSTEFDRSGEHINQMIYDFERRGMHAADKVIAVSYYTRSVIISRYGVSGDKVEVVHNGVERNGDNILDVSEDVISRDEKIVLFLGRITMQKGPDYFLKAAKRVLEVMDNVRFVMAGSGDMMYRAIEMAAEMGIGQKVLFTGFLRGDDVKKIYRLADIFVMPSVSEPFGLVPLEALDNDVPVIISNQSGVSEVLKHVLKVDFWDVDDIANKIIAVLKYPPLRIMLRNHGNFEVRKLKWKDSAAKCLRIYEDTLVAV
ncbi:MAG: glycosyltransferase family 4 protein [Planctomycetota bacterium]|jgi:glycosyltransferase involved in cell wall biosynthesis